MTEKLFVIKIGGNVIDNTELLSQFLKHLGFTKSKFILVHGGGKLATKLAEKLGIETTLIEGRRITSPEMLEIAQMVYGGLINKNIVANLQQNHKNALGFTGADANLIKAVKRPVKTIDYGLVGDVIDINDHFLNQILNLNITPVIAPLSYSKEHGILNTNADTIASEIAKAMSKFYKVSLVYCFEKRGVLLDINDENSVISEITPSYYEKLKEEKLIFEGMIPKLDNAFAAINVGVKEVIINLAEHIDSVLENKPTGTRIIAS